MDTIDHITTLVCVRAPTHPQNGNHQVQRSLTTKSALSPARKLLLRRMQEVNFGSIEGLQLCKGEPLMSSAPRIKRSIKIGGRGNDVRPEFTAADFVLKAPIDEMFDHFDQISDATLTIQVRDGLPTHLTVEY